MIKKTLFLLVTGILCSLSHGQEIDSFTHSILYKAIYDTVIPTVTRPLMSAPFDIVTISRQVTGNSYSGIFASFNKQQAPVLFNVLTPHAVEITLKSSVYFLYSYTTQQATKYLPDLSKEYPFIPEIAAVSVIAFFDIGFVNPFERIKVCHLNKIAIPFYRDEKLVFSDLIKNREWLFKGGALTFSSTAVHLGTFLTLNYHIKHFLFKKDGALTFYESCTVGPILSTIQAIITFPLLTLRARLHAERFKSGQEKLSSLQYVKTLWHSNSMPTLYHGWRARVIRGTLIAIFDTYWLNKIKKRE